MQLLNELYKVESLTHGDGSAKATLSLMAGSVIFGAHFPGNPVMPGVCLIQTAVELAEAVTGRHMTLSTVRNAKFLNPVSPVASPVIDVDLRMATSPDNASTMTLTAVITTPQGMVCAKLSLICSIS